MAEPRDPRSPEVFTLYIALLQNINALGFMGFAQILDNLEPQEMTNLLNIGMHLQAFIEAKRPK